jgi:hypothetical protein
MTTESNRIELACDIHLARRDGGTLLCAAGALAEEGGVVWLDATLPAETWSQVVADSALGLVTEDLETGDPDAFDATRPVDVQLLMREGLPTGLRATDVADQLVQGAGAGSLANAWVIAVATQEVALDDVEGVSAKAILRTGWSVQPEGESALQQHVAEWLTQSGAEITVVDEDLLRVPMAVDGHEWVMLGHVDEATRVVAFYSVLPHLVPEEARHDVALFLVGQNYEMHFGSFEMDPEDGEVRLRTGWAGGASELPSGEQLYELVAPHAPLMLALIEAMGQQVAEAQGS